MKAAFGQRNIEPKESLNFSFESLSGNAFISDKQELCLNVLVSFGLGFVNLRARRDRNLNTLIAGKRN